MRLAGRVRGSIMEATDNARFPVIVDASSCTADTLLPRLETAQPVDSMTIHPACSVVQLGMVGDVEKVARATATELHIRSACIAVVMPATAACSTRAHGFRQPRRGRECQGAERSVSRLYQPHV
ncbi:hypothetical protein [Corynebacterium macginleyi]